jgi:folate-binding protein YgfZ
LHNISTNDVNALPLGGGCELYFCNPQAKALFAAWAYHVKLADDRHAIWLETTPGRSEALLQHLDRFLIAEAVELIDVTDQYAQWHLAGPSAKSVLEAAIGSSLPDLAEFQHMERTLGGVGCNIRRRDQLGLSGYDIVCEKNQATDVKTALISAGATLAGPETFETLRIEAGTPVYGVDIDESRFVMEIGRAARAVSFSKGCFPGQEPIVMARDRAGRVNRQFLGLRVRGDRPLRPGTKLTRDGKDVGIVTSSTHSPRLGGPLSLGYVHWQSATPGTPLDADGTPVEVIGYPPLGG